ncbi:hypothetical protein Agub_g581, partial [Astrephomene gubernaculifera]
DSKIFSQQTSLQAYIINMDSDEGLEVRQLQASDYDKGFLDVLAHLTTVGEVSRDLFEEQLRRRDADGSYRTVVIEDGGRIVATAAMVIELKFIHACSKADRCAGGRGSRGGLLQGDPGLRGGQRGVLREVRPHTQGGADGSLPRPLRSKMSTGMARPVDSWQCPCTGPVMKS